MSRSVNILTQSATHVRRLLRPIKLCFGLSRGRFSEATPPLDFAWRPSGGRHFFLNRQIRFPTTESTMHKPTLRTHASGLSIHASDIEIADAQIEVEVKTYLLWTAAEAMTAAGMRIARLERTCAVRHAGRYRCSVR